MKRILPVKTVTVIVLSSLFLVFGCNQSGDSKKEDKQATKKQISADSIEANVKDIIYPLPSPFNLYQRLDDIGASYLGHVLNPAANRDQYFTERDKALNLGVYAADLSYVTTYDRSQEIQEYSRAVKLLADDLNIKIDFNHLSSQEAKEKLQDKDSLVDYITKVFHKTYSFLNEKGKPSLSALMISGVWSEGLYIATHISDDTYNNYEIVKLIYDQKQSLKKVIELLEKFDNDERVATLHKAFSKLMKIYEEAGTDLTKKELNKITSAIEQIREGIVS